MIIREANYYDIAIPAPLRLDAMKKEARRVGATSWRRVRHSTLKTVQNGNILGFHKSAPDNAKDAVWYSHDPRILLRRERTTSDVMRDAGMLRASRDMKGWYTDVDAAELAWGMVWYLGRGRFLAGYKWDANGEKVIYPFIYDDVEDAARAADRHAEKFAEEQREDSEKYDTARRIEADIEASLVRLRELLALRHYPRMAHVRESIEGMIGSVRDLRDRLNNEFADYI